ncbi:hypothetical protein JCM10212_004805 [Sporobolomyces blumeae]
MSDDPAAPADITAGSVQTAPDPPSDSAPPPVAAPASVALPPRSYSAQPVYVAAPPAYAPNSSVPKFVRLLATLLFLGGSIGAAVAWFYRRVVYPRLVVALKARIQLFSVHEAKYSQLFDSLRSFTLSTSCARLGGTEAISFVKGERAKVGEASAGTEFSTEATKEGALAEKEPLHGQGNELRSDAGNAETDAAGSLPPPPRLLVPLQESLAALHDSLSRSSKPLTPTSSTSLNPSNLVQPQGQLMRSFVTFNEYLESELYSISSTANAYRAYGSSVTNPGSTGAASGSGERKALHEATQAFKSEIRSIKGALLNRRNFVRPEIATTA